MYEEEKEELVEAVDFLKIHVNYKALGARILSKVSSLKVLQGQVNFSAKASW